MQNGAYSFFLKAEVKPGSDGTKIRRSEKFFTNKYVFKKIKLFFGISKLDEQLYEYLT